MGCMGLRRRNHGVCGSEEDESWGVWVCFF